MSSIICIGDFGTGSYDQECVSNLMNELILQNNTKLIIGLGDNIYPDGVESVHDSQFYHKFAKIYHVTNEYFYFFIFGNYPFDYF